MTTVFLRKGISYYPTAEAQLDVHPVLPPGNFTVCKDAMTGELYLEQIASFPTYSKVYGNMKQRVERFSNTFTDRSASTGVLLTGEKGSGKTMVAKLLCLWGEANGIPTIVINHPWTGDQFNTLIQSINQPAIVLIDEFEKVYDYQQQEKMLTLLDGVYPSKKMFILTCNDKYRINQHMRNRPGRLFYSVDFVGLPLDMIIEYCKDVLKPSLHEHIDTIGTLSAMFTAFNFDMLQALVQEMNRYDLAPYDALEDLNVTPVGDEGNYKVEVTFNGEKLPESQFDPTSLSGSPIGKTQIDLEFYAADGDKATDVQAIAAFSSIQLTPSDLTNMDIVRGQFVYQREGYKVVVTRREDPVFNYRSLNLTA